MQNRCAKSSIMRSIFCASPGSRNAERNFLPEKAENQKDEQEPKKKGRANSPERLFKNHVAKVLLLHKEFEHRDVERFPVAKGWLILMEITNKQRTLRRDTLRSRSCPGSGRRSSKTQRWPRPYSPTVPSPPKTRCPTTGRCQKRAMPKNRPSHTFCGEMLNFLRPWMLFFLFSSCSGSVVLSGVSDLFVQGCQDLKIRTPCFFFFLVPWCPRVAAQQARLFQYAVAVAVTAAAGGPACRGHVQRVDVTIHVLQLLFDGRNLQLKDVLSLGYLVQNC